MKRRRATIVIGLLLTGAVAAVAVIDRISNDRTQPLVRTLTADDREKARSIVARDRGLERILGDHGYKVESIAHWNETAPRRHRRKLANCLAVVELAVKPPIKKLTTDWSYLGGDARSKPCLPFEPPARVRITVADLRSVGVTVDLRRSRIVAIVPDRAKHSRASSR